MRAKLAALLAALALSAGASIAAGQTRSDSQLTAPDPQPPPGPAYPGIAETDMASECIDIRSGARRPRFYPDRALERGVSGAALLDCVIGEDGHMQTCQVLDERPRNYAFGAAATRIACHFQVDVTTITEGAPSATLPPESQYYRRTGDGEPWRVRVPVRFRLQ